MLSFNENGQWDIVVTSLQDICSANESNSFENRYENNMEKLDEKNSQDLRDLYKEVSDHQSNISTARRLIQTSQEHLQKLLSQLDKEKPPSAVEINYSSISGSPLTEKASLRTPNNKSTKRGGRLFYTSKFNPLEPIYVGSEVAYKLRNRLFEEWIQCVVLRILSDGTKFEIRDPEPDENNFPGQAFKANYKEILLIPSKEQASSLSPYPYGTKVLARYPETTTFYPAIVVGNRKSGHVRLKFDEEEEANKETEAERRLVLPFPE